VESDEDGLHELASGHENQATMVLRPLAKIDRQRHARAEDDHVAPENREEGRSALPVDHSYLEPQHDYRHHEAREDHGYGQCRTKPAQHAMHADLAQAHQGRLRDEQHDPGREGRGVKPQQQWSWRLGMQQARIDRMAEGPDRKPGHQQRHAEIEISAQKGLETAGRADLRTSRERHLANRDGTPVLCVLTSIGAHRSPLSAAARDSKVSSFESWER